MKLWGRVTSINVQKALWALAELEIPYERIDAGLSFGVVDTPEYRAMNPNGRVPVLDDDGFTLWESHAIVRYLVRRYGQGRLVPPGDQSLALADQWMDWQATVLQPAMLPAFWGLIRTPVEKRDNAAIERGVAAVEAALDLLDGALAGRDYILGSEFSMADIPLGAAAARWKKMPVPQKARADLDRWYAAISERPAFRKHLDLPLS